MEMHQMEFTPQSNKQPVIHALLITAHTVVYGNDFIDMILLHLWTDPGLFCTMFVSLSHENVLVNREEIVAGNQSNPILDFSLGKKVDKTTKAIMQYWCQREISKYTSQGMASLPLVTVHSPW